MTVGYLGKYSNDSRDVTGRQVQTAVENQWGPIPGVTVSEWNGRTVNVQPLYKPIHNGQPVDMPVLFEVPLDQPMSGNAGMTMPVPVGTPVMLAPQMRAMDDYEEGEGGQPYDARAFHLSTMRASLTGGERLSQEIPNIDLENTHIRFSPDGNFGIKGSPDGKFRIDGAEGNLYDIIATFMELVASDTLQINYGSSAGTGHALENRAQLMELAAKVRAMQL
jgi:Phage protein Gp138 N-terminal domain